MCKIGLFIRISLNSLQEPTIAVNLDGISRYNRHAVTVTVKLQPFDHQPSKSEIFTASRQSRAPLWRSLKAYLCKLIPIDLFGFLAENVGHKKF